MIEKGCKFKFHKVISKRATVVLCEVMMLFHDARTPCLYVGTCQVSGILVAFDDDFPI